MSQLEAIQYTRSRTSDPATSHAAAKRAERFAQSHARRILFALRKFGPSTAAEIGYSSGLSVEQCCRRTVEMQRAGLIAVKVVDGQEVQRNGYRVWEALV